MVDETPSSTTVKAAPTAPNKTQPNATPTRTSPPRLSHQDVLPAEASTDGKVNVVLMTQGVEGPEFSTERDGISKHVAPHAVFFDVTAQPNEVYIKALEGEIDKVENEFKGFGVLCVDSHGVPNALCSQEGAADISVKQLLRDIIELKKKKEAAGKTVTIDRLVFTGCDTFNQLRWQDVDDYLALAKKLGTPIVGPASLFWGNERDFGRVVVFAPNSTVRLDKLSADQATVDIAQDAVDAGEKGYYTVHSQWKPYSHEWVYCYVDKATAEEGKQALLAKKAEWFDSAEKALSPDAPSDLKLSAIGADLFDSVIDGIISGSSKASETLKTETTKVQTTVEQADVLRLSNVQMVQDAIKSVDNCNPQTVEGFALASSPDGAIFAVLGYKQFIAALQAANVLDEYRKLVLSAEPAPTPRMKMAVIASNAGTQTTSPALG
jgi:hypothetical protein